jgi:hypothetical protein
LSGVRFAEMRLLDQLDDLGLFERKISHTRPPHPRSCFFEQEVFQGEVGNNLLQSNSFATMTT